MRSVLCLGLFLALTSTLPPTGDLNFATVRQHPILEEDSTPTSRLTELRHRTLDWTSQRTSQLDLDSVVGIYSNADTPVVEPFLRLARERIGIEIYEIEDPPVIQALTQQLANRVKISIVQEPVVAGDNCNAFGSSLSGRSARTASEEMVKACRAQQELVRKVRDGGGQYVSFQSEQLCGRDKKEGRCFQHGKMAIVDDKLALLSTGNFNPSNLCDPSDKTPNTTCYRDYTYITRDRGVVQAFKDILAYDLEGVRNRPKFEAILNRPEVAGKITVSPYTFEPLTNFFQSANKTLIIQQQYIRPNSGLAEVLINIAKNQKKVDVLLTDFCYYGRPSEKLAYESHLMFSAMEQAGVRVRMMSKTRKINDVSGYLHAKAAVVDGGRAWVGSANGSKESLNQNREFGIFFSHPQRVKALEKFMAVDFEDPSNEPWRESLLCRNKGYQDPEALTADNDVYQKSIREMEAKLKAKLANDNEEDLPVD